jgi:alpha-ketoglutaric semialdehyde dehydrogenase
MMSARITSIVGGAPVTGAPGGRITSTNPARISEAVADVWLGDASVFVAAATAARQAQPAWADVPAPSSCPTSHSGSRTDRI